MATKISLIGAGSACFSLALIKDLCLTPNLSGSQVCLMDISAQRLDAAYGLCMRYAQEVGSTLELVRTTERDRALEGADFVINTALVGGHQRLQDGYRIGKKHGYHYGSYHVMHDEGFWINYYQFHLFEALVHDMQRYCPQAWLLLVANPVLAGTTFLTRKYPWLKMVGLCHGFSAVYHLAEALGLDREGLTFEVPGVNHFVWLTHIYYRGEDVFPLLDQWIEEKAPAYWRECRPSSDLGPKAVDLYRRFGAFPIGDTCTPGGGSWPWWYHSDAETEKRWHEDPHGWWWDGYFAGCAHQVEEIRRVVDDRTSQVTAWFPPKHSGEVMVPIIESIACDIPRVIIGNLPNHGDYVPGVPRDFAVEIPTLVSKRGIQGIQTGGLPAPLIAYILRDRVAPVNLELEAYERGSRELLLLLIRMDPWSRSEKQAWQHPSRTIA